jgi:hypothetical protein
VGQVYFVLLAAFLLAFPLAAASVHRSTIGQGAPLLLRAGPAQKGRVRRHPRRAGRPIV